MYRTPLALKTFSFGGCDIRQTSPELSSLDAKTKVLNIRIEFEEAFKLQDLSRAREYGWIDKGKPDHFIPTKAMADLAINQLLDLISRDDQGMIRREGFR